MPETTQAGPCGELHEKLSACVSANVSTVDNSSSENGDKNFSLHFFGCRKIFGLKVPKNAQFHV